MDRVTLGARRRDKILNNLDRHLKFARTSLRHLNEDINASISNQQGLTHEKQLRVDSSIKENSYSYWNPKMNRNLRMASNPNRLVQVYTKPRASYTWDIDYHYRVRMNDQGVFFIRKPGSNLPILTRDEYGLKILTNLEPILTELEREQHQKELESRLRSRRRSNENLFQQNWPLLDRRSTLSMFDMITKPGTEASDK